MFYPQDYQSFFEQFIEAKTNPFVIKTKSVWKESDQIKSSYQEESIELTKCDNLMLDILERGNQIELEFWTNNFWQRLFKRKKNNVLIKILKENQNKLVHCSKETQKLLSQRGIAVDCDDNLCDNIIVITERSRLVWMTRGSLLWTNYDASKFTIIKLV